MIEVIGLTISFSRQRVSNGRKINQKTFRHLGIRNLNILEPMAAFLLKTTVDCGAVHKAVKLDNKLIKDRVKSS